MSYILKLKTHIDDGALLTVIEKNLPFSIKRVFYIYNLTDQKRGFHRHKVTKQALIAINGSCEIYCNSRGVERIYKLDSPEEALILEPEDWHTMKNFKDNSILLVLASTEYDINDYLTERY